MSANNVKAKLNGDNYTTQIQVGKHQLIADEPTDLGGRDLGSSPYELVSAALAACTAITVRMYANRKEWDLKEINVEVEHGKIHAEDCKNCDDNRTGKIDQFIRRIEFVGDFNEKQIERLLYIADRCPVHKTLSTSSSIITELIN